MDGSRDLEMVRVDAARWLLRDRPSSMTGDPAVVARVEESEDGFDVRWIDPGIPLPRRYLSREDVVADFVRWQAQRVRSTRPVEIASLPPFARSRRR